MKKLVVILLLILATDAYCDTTKSNIKKTTANNSVTYESPDAKCTKTTQTLSLPGATGKREDFTCTMGNKTETSWKMYAVTKDLITPLDSSQSQEAAVKFQILEINYNNNN